MNPHAVRKGGTHHIDETVEREGELSVFGFILGALSAKFHLVSSSSELRCTKTKTGGKNHSLY